MINREAIARDLQEKARISMHVRTRRYRCELCGRKSRIQVWQSQYLQDSMRCACGADFTALKEIPGRWQWLALVCTGNLGYWRETAEKARAKTLQAATEKATRHRCRACNTVLAIGPNWDGVSSRCISCIKLDDYARSTPADLYEQAAEADAGIPLPHSTCCVCGQNLVLLDRPRPESDSRRCAYCQAAFEAGRAVGDGYSNRMLFGHWPRTWEDPAKDVQASRIATPTPTVHAGADSGKPVFSVGDKVVVSCRDCKDREHGCGYSSAADGNTHTILKPANVFPGEWCLRSGVNTGPICPESQLTHAPQPVGPEADKWMWHRHYGVLKVVMPIASTPDHLLKATFNSGRKIVVRYGNLRPLKLSEAKTPEQAAQFVGRRAVCKSLFPHGHIEYTGILTASVGGPGWSMLVESARTVHPDSLRKDFVGFVVPAQASDPEADHYTVLVEDIAEEDMKTAEIKTQAGNVIRLAVIGEKVVLTLTKPGVGGVEVYNAFLDEAVLLRHCQGEEEAREV